MMLSREKVVKVRTGQEDRGYIHGLVLFPLQLAQHMVVAVPVGQVAEVQILVAVVVALPMVQLGEVDRVIRALPAAEADRYMERLIFRLCTSDQVVVGGDVPKTCRVAAGPQR